MGGTIMKTRDIKPIKNSNGITVPQLIKFLQSLPEADHEDDVGEVWVEVEESHGMMSSSLCYTAHKLNKNDVLLRMDLRLARLMETKEKDK
jgi:hypothetical protein